MNLKPIYDKIIVKQSEADDKISGTNLIAPESSKEKPKRGKIVAVGQGKLLEDGKRAQMQVKKGDEVLFSSYAGTDITVGTKEMIVMSEDDILAIIA